MRRLGDIGGRDEPANPGACRAEQAQLVQRRLAAPDEHDRASREVEKDRQKAHPEHPCPERELFFYI